MIKTNGGHGRRPAAAPPDWNMQVQDDLSMIPDGWLPVADAEGDDDSALKDSLGRYSARRKRK